MSNELKKDICFLCGNDAESMIYDRGNWVAFIECKNKSCGEYLITRAAMNKLESDVAQRKEFSKYAMSKEKIKAEKKIFVISYDGGIIPGFKPLKELTKGQISRLGFSKDI